MASAMSSAAALWRMAVAVRYFGRNRTLKPG
jgi:hypothetical protein